MKAHLKHSQLGFTLIELIVSFVILAIAAAMAAAYFGPAMTRSSTPVLKTQHSCNLTAVMENIVADFNRLNPINLRFYWQASQPGKPIQYNLDSVVTPFASPNGHYYKCIAAGTSGTSEPAWPTASGATVTDNTITWKESGQIVWQGANHAYTAGSYVVPTNIIGGSNPNPNLVNHYYKCTTSGNSGPTEPQWPVTSGSTISETGCTGTCATWQEAGTILSTTVTNDNLSYYLTNNPARYGTGYTAATSFIQFKSGNIEVTAGTNGTSSEQNILKVTIQSSNPGESAETLTTYFTIY